MGDTEPSNFPDHPTEAPQPDAGRLGQRRARLWPIRARSDTTTRACRSRLAAIIAADVVDYSRHMAEDEIGTHARFTAICRRMIEPAIARYDARIVKNTGDGFLAEFASATAAVRCALEFQSAIHVWNSRRRRGRLLQFRVGINLGDVIIEPDDVFGHSVNVAARLEALAEPGGILISYPVFASIRDFALAFEDLGELTLKNMAETVRGFRVRAGRSSLTRTVRRP
jgi:class 3 adenylate cyclase